MEIGKENYGAWFLDYIEGRLDAVATGELFAFLEAHPGLRKELEEYQAVTLRPDRHIRYPDTHDLKRRVIVPSGPVNAGNYESWLVADLEGDLEPDKKIHLERFLDGNPLLGRERDIYGHCRLRPDYSVVCPGKSELKMAVPLISFKMRAALAVAASMLLLAGSYFLLRDEGRSVRKFPLEIVMVPIKAAKLDPPEHRTHILSQRNLHRISVGVTPAERDHLPGLESIPTRLLAVQEDTKSGLNPSSGTDWIIRRNTFGALGSLLSQAEKQSFAAHFAGGLIRKTGILPAQDRSVGPASRSFLDQLVSGYNLLTDRDITVTRFYNSEGRLIAMDFGGEEVAYMKRRIPGSE
ncbi:MAG: hypothetical protein JW861_07880 [Bacteroidales bacterium]|nr:hypothetical protein [Bacteroidales bacterium]